MKQHLFEESGILTRTVHSGEKELARQRKLGKGPQGAGKHKIMCGAMTRDSSDGWEEKACAAQCHWNPQPKRIMEEQS